MIDLASLFAVVVVCLSCMYATIRQAERHAAETREFVTGIMAQRSAMLNAVISRTPKDFGILQKLDTPTPTPQVMTEDGYLEWIQKDFEDMGFDPSAVLADAEIPQRPHGL